MERLQLKTLAGQLETYGGKIVTVAGWAKSIRDSKAFGFIELNDGSCFKNTQIVFERETLKNYDEIAHQNVGLPTMRTPHMPEMLNTNGVTVRPTPSIMPSMMTLTP